MPFRGGNGGVPLQLLADKGPAIYVVHLNRYFVIPP